MKTSDEILMEAGTTGLKQGWFTRPEVKKAVALAQAEATKEWEENVLHLLNTTPGAVRACPGGGKEVLLDSLITTFMKLRSNQK